MNYQNKIELEKLLANGCTDSDVEDFIDKHPNINKKQVWDYVYEHNIPTECKGCKFVQMTGMMPCIKCVRQQTNIKDYYEKR